LTPDRQLVVAAVQKAGGQKALAGVFGVAQSAISEWGRTRPIPRHVKPRLEDYLKPTRATVGDPGEAVLSGETQTWPVALQELVRLFQPERVGPRLAQLPRRDRQRYEERVTEIVTRVTRELDEFQTLLEAEHRFRRRRERRRE